MDNNIHNITRGLVRAILILTEEQRHSSIVQSLCQYIYCKFSIDDQEDANATCLVRPDRLSLPEESQITENLSFSIAARYISLYVYPIFIFMGIFGNSLSCFIMFLNVKRNGYSANLYLTLLAFVDCLYLLGSAFPYWLSHIDYKLDIKLLSDFFCRFAYWFGNFTTHLSAGLVVSVTVERFIAIKYPLIAHKINTVKNTHIVLIILVTFFSLLDSRVFILVKHFNESIHIVLTCYNDTYIKYERRDVLHCDMSNEINDQTWVFIDFAVYTLIPFLIIVTLNSLIIHRLIGAQRLRQSMSHSSRKATKPEQEHLQQNTSEIDQADIEKEQYPKRFRSIPTRAPMVRPQINQCPSVKQSTESNGSSSVEIKTRSHYQYQSTINHPRTNTNNIRLTVLLLFISGTFLALTLPAVVLNLIMSTRFKDRSSIFLTYLNFMNENSHSDTILYHSITHLLMIVNHSINFILYFVVGKRFRRDLKILCFGYCRKLSRRSQSQQR